MTDQIYPTTHRPATIEDVDSWEKNDETVASAPEMTTPGIAAWWGNALAAAAPALAALRAEMREEWGIVAVYLGRHEVEEWGFDTRDDALDEASALDLDELRIVRRYVTTPETDQ